MMSDTPTLTLWELCQHDELKPHVYQRLTTWPEAKYEICEGGREIVLKKWEPTMHGPFPSECWVEV